MPSKLDYCRQCGEKKPLSSRGLCIDCAQSNINRAVDEMRQKKGAIYRAWKKAVTRGAKKV